MREVEHHEHHHGNADATKARLEQEAAQFKDTRTDSTTRQTHSTAATAIGEHIHHHVHEVREDLLLILAPLLIPDRPSNPSLRRKQSSPKLRIPPFPSTKSTTMQQSLIRHQYAQRLAWQISSTKEVFYTGRRNIAFVLMESRRTSEAKRTTPIDHKMLLDCMIILEVMRTLIEK